MNLDNAQQKTVTAWIAEGLKLSEIQKRLESELGIRMTYMEVRLLVDDLKLVPKDLEPDKPVDSALGKTGSSPSALPDTEGEAGGIGEVLPEGGEATPGAGSVSVMVDAVARPGALVSGSVQFSDGNSATWSLDQMGRIGLMPKQPGYKPSQPEVQAFQMELQKQLAKFGF